MKSRLLRHLQVLLWSLGRLCRTPLATAQTLGGIGVALAVPLTLFVLVSNLEGLFGEFGTAPRISVYLETGAGERFADELAARLGGETAIDTVAVIDRDRALEDLLRHASLAGVADVLEENPLPMVLEIRPVPGLDKEAYRALGDRLVALAGVAAVQLDLDWVARLTALTELAMAVVRVFWVLLFAGVAMVISNTVRLGLVTARAQIEVISLVGGSEPFIRRPYLYLGLLQGMLGAVVAVVIAAIVFHFLSPALARLLDVYLGIGDVRFAPVALLARMVLVAGLIGWAAAFVTTWRYLREVLPR